MKTVINALSYNHEDHPGEKCDKVSMCVPDQTLSLKQILERFARGLPATGFLEGAYNGEDEIPDLRKMDISEVHDLAEAVRNNIQEHRDNIAEQTRKKAAEKFEQRIQDELKKRSQKPPIEEAQIIP